jgi:hypothetical protein
MQSFDCMKTFQDEKVATTRRFRAANVQCRFSDPHNGNCEFVAKSNAGLQCHMNRVHGIPNPIGFMAVSNVCPMCRVVMSCKSARLVHLQNTWKFGSCPTRVGNPVGCVGHEEVNPKVLTCRECHCNFESFKGLLDHLQCHGFVAGISSLGAGVGV